MAANAKTPERVSDKMRECRYFLVQMADYEAALDVEKFLFCLSAFLSAFRTVAYRLYGVIENRNGKAASRTLKEKLHHHPEISFLLARSNIEVHEDGVMVHQRFTIHFNTSTPARWPSKFDKQVSKWQPRWESRFDQGVMVRQAGDWQFAGNPKNLIELCHDALTAIEEYARQALTPTAQAASSQLSVESD